MTSSKLLLITVAQDDNVVATFVFFLYNSLSNFLQMKKDMVYDGYWFHAAAADET